MISWLLAIGLSESFMTDSTKGATPYSSSYELSERSVRPALSLEARGDAFGVMLSYGEAGRKAHNVAYKDCVHADIRQDMQAKWLGLQGTYTYQIWRFGLGLRAGVASVHSTNHEYGTYDATQWVEHRNNTSEVRPLYGVAADYDVAKQWKARVEWQHMSHVEESQWTLSNTVNTVSFQLVRAF